MDRNEKKKIRGQIGEHLDVSSARLTDDEAVFLRNFIDEYDETYKGQSEVRQASHDGWSSDGEYTRWEDFTDTFTDDIGIRQDYKYHDDDGQHGESSSEIRDARGILNWFRDHR
jgi:nuclear transport factor 2 (NTF2) superfamily protein